MNLVIASSSLLEGNFMCGDMFTNRERRNEPHEDYGNILAEQDENKTNEQTQKEYDEKKRVW